MQKFRLVSLLVAGALVIAVGVFLTRGSKSTDTVDLLLFGNAEEIAAYRKLTDKFHENQHEVKVSLIEASDRKDLLTRLSTSFASGNPPDLFLLNYRYIPSFAAKNTLEPLNDRLAHSRAFAADDFYSEALKAFSLSDKQVCLPQNISSLVVYYNRSLFESGKVAEPQAGWKWLDMIATAKKLTKDTDNDGFIDQYGLGIDPELIRLAPFVWSNEGKLVDQENDPHKFALDEPAALEVIRQFQVAFEESGAMPNEAVYESQDHESRFMDGKLAMYFSSRRSTPTFRTIDTFDWDIASLPIFKQPASVLHSDGYCMTAGSKHKDAAWKFMEFALGEEGQRSMAKTGRTVPSLKKVAQSESFLDKNAKPSHAQVFLDSIPTIHQFPAVSTWAEIEDKANNALEVGLFQEQAGKKTTPEQIAESIIKDTTPIFERAE